MATNFKDLTEILHQSLVDANLSDKQFNIIWSAINDVHSKLRITSVSVCSCDWKKKTKNLLIGLEAQHIDKFMQKANTQEFLHYGISYMLEVKKIINKR